LLTNCKAQMRFPQHNNKPKKQHRIVNLCLLWKGDLIFLLVPCCELSLRKA
jgi:hypothetical protein